MGTKSQIILGDASENKRRAAVQFARSFDTLDDETARKILELLKDKGESN